VSQLSRQCGILNISQPYTPPRPVAGIALVQRRKGDPGRTWNDKNKTGNGSSTEEGEVEIAVYNSRILY
jgi:hypothetical protein